VAVAEQKRAWNSQPKTLTEALLRTSGARLPEPLGRARLITLSLFS